MSHDLSGMRFKEVTAIRRLAPINSKGRWLCQCRCGTFCARYETHLLRGMTGTCTGHGVGQWPEHSSWSAMNDRVNLPNHEAFHRYGGRGVKVCKRWESFLNFYEDMGPRPPGKTLDRFPDKDGDYEPGNCRWATNQEQQNNLSSNRYVEYEGKRFTIAELGRHLGVNYVTLWSRLQRGIQPGVVRC